LPRLAGAVIEQVEQTATNVAIWASAGAAHRGLPRSAVTDPRLRRREAHQRPQAVHRHRHPLPAYRRGGLPRERPDRDGAKHALLSLYLADPVRFVFVDAGFAGQLLDWATRILRTTIEVVRKPKEQRGFAVIPRRWAVERTLAWLTAHRRLARDYERHPAHSEAMIRWAAINLMLRRLTRGRAATGQSRRTFDWRP
jgi:transposase